MKIEILNNPGILEQAIFSGFERLNLKDVSKMNIIPKQTIHGYYTEFIFRTKNNLIFQFKYNNNQKITRIKMWSGEDYSLGVITLNPYDKEKEKWINTIWDQFVNRFNLRIRLLFIDKCTPWIWSTEFTYQKTKK